MESNQKSGLYGALDNALSLPTEKERMLAILDCIRGYRSEFDQNEQKLQNEGFMKCKNEYRHQIQKIKDYISK